MKSDPPSRGASHLIAAQNVIQQWADARPGADLRVLAVIVETYRLHQAIENEFRTYAQREFGLGTGDVRILFALRRASGKPLRATDLFQSLLVSSGAVTKQIDRLEAQGYVRRDPDPKQRNQRLISLTDAGRAVADKAIGDTLATSPVAAKIAELPTAEVDQLIATIARILG